MNFVEPNVVLIGEPNPFKKIERIGRLCYKSISPYTEESAKNFFKSLVKKGHYAMLEHVTYVFEVDEDLYHSLKGNSFLNYTCDNDRYLVSGNLRALNEIPEQVPAQRALLAHLQNIDPMLVYNEDANTDPYPAGFSRIVDTLSLPEMTDNEFYNHVYLSMQFICDRGVSHELVRHRVASFAQESTRYCNYGSDKFNKEITIVMPSGNPSWTFEARQQYLTCMLDCETAYLKMLEEGCTPQEARAVLPNSLKTEIVMTACAGEYEHFFDLRSRGLTGKPHPDMRVVADKALVLFDNVHALYED